MYGYDIFHNDIMKTLINTVHTEGATHSYIFDGANGLHIKECAKLLAAAVVCDNHESSPCGQCTSCQLSRAGTHPDIIMVDKGDKKSIGVEPVRELNNGIIVKPFESSKKVYIIDEADKMTEPAQNAFLKTLEEPPSFVTFILLTEDSSSLLTTVLSRCMLVKFGNLGIDAVREYIKKTYPHEERVEFLANFSQGNPGMVDAIVTDDEFENQRADAFEMLTSLIAPQPISAYTVAGYIKEHSENIEMMLDFWLGFMRDILMIQVDSSDLVVNNDYMEKLNKRAMRLSEKFSIHAIECITRAKLMLARYVNTRALVLWLSFEIKKGWNE